MKMLDKVVGFITDVTHIPVDKLYHGIAGAVVAGAGMCFTADLREVMALVLAVGIGKEIYDGIANKIAGKDVHDVDLFDVLATVIGGAIVVGISLLSV